MMSLHLHRSPWSIFIVHRFWSVFKASSWIGAELLCVGASWSSCLCSSICRGSQEYVTYASVPTSPPVSCVSGSSNLDSFHDGGGEVAIKQLVCEVLPPGVVQYCSEHSCVGAVKIFLCSASIQQYLHDRWLEKMHFILSVKSDFRVTDRLSITVHSFASHVMMSISLDETLLPKYVNLSTSFRELTFSEEMSSILFAYTWRPMPEETRSRLCSRDLAWAGVFARNAMSSMYSMFRNYLYFIFFPLSAWNSFLSFYQ